VGRQLRQRDGSGWLLPVPKPDIHGDPEYTLDQRGEPHVPPPMAPEEIRGGLKALWCRAPKYTKSDLARLMGFRGKAALQTFKGVMRGTAWLLEPQARHIARVLRCIERGDLSIYRTSQLHKDGRPVYVWRWAIRQPKLARVIPLPGPRRPGRPKKQVDGRAASW
jgi:hypothetical protein